MIFFCALFMILVGILFVSSSFKVFQKHTSLEDEVNAMENEVNTLEDENEALRQMLLYIKTPEFIELQAKHKLGLKRPEEEVIVITDIGEKGIIGSLVEDLQDNEHAQEVASNPTHWWQYFFSEER